MPKKPKPTGELPKEVLNLDEMKGGQAVPALYANSIRIMVSLFDFTLIVGQAAIGSNGQAEMREAARINLSPQHAKALAGVLANRVNDYEAQFGVISLGPSEKGGHV
jgi:hypothetical protein